MAAAKPAEQASEKSASTVDVVAVKDGIFKRNPYKEGDKLSVTHAQKAIMLAQGAIQGDS